LTSIGLVTAAARFVCAELAVVVCLTKMDKLAQRKNIDVRPARGVHTPQQAPAAATAPPMQIPLWGL
jgi:hypothetical protein